MNRRTKRCTVIEARGHLRKAAEFLEAAKRLSEDERDGLPDAVVSMCVHAGIAASDALCCALLGEHSSGPHNDAASLLRTIATGGDGLSRLLSELLFSKSRAQYSHLPVPPDTVVHALANAESLVRAASDRVAG
jgi:hypothetical protein